IPANAPPRSAARAQGRPSDADAADMMVERRRDYGYVLFGYVLAGLGSVALIGSLWRPWYSFRVPQALLDQAAQSAAQFGALAPLVRQSANLIGKLGPLHVTAWDISTVTPAVLVGIGVVGAGLSALMLTGRATGGARLVAWIGLAGIVLTLYRFIVRPDQSELLHPAWGIYVALIGAACMLAGGLRGV